MATLRQYLAATPRRMLLAIAQARGVRIPWEAPKTDLVTVLADKLLDSAQLGQVLESFSEAEHRVLNDLVAVGGRIPRRYLAHRYGDVRPYRPWQPDAPRRPWENPVSPVERLWFLGLIFLEPSTDDLVVPDDLMPHLPSPEQRPPQPVPGQGGLEPALLAAHDLACLLGLLQRDDVRPLHGRWLPPRTLAAWGERCAWPPAAPDVRSELQTGRRRFLHYLAEVAGLLGRAGPYLTPTPAAWLWLESSPAGRLNKLWYACVLPGDRRPAPESRRDRIWREYRLPGHDLLPAPTRLATAVAHAMRDLDPAHPAAFAEALLARQPELRDLLPANLLEPETALATTIVQLLAGPFVWLGALSESESDRESESESDRESDDAYRYPYPYPYRYPYPSPSPYPYPSSLSVTAWGAAWLGLAPAPEVPPRPRFAVTSETTGDPEAGEPGALIFTLRQGLPDPADLMVMMEVGSRGYGVWSMELGGAPSRHGGSRRDARTPTPNSQLPTPYSLLPTPYSRYRITAASFARALHRGWSAPALLDALEHSAERPLTGQERAMLRAWAEAAGRMAVRRLTVLEVTDPAIINRLAASRRGRDLIVRTLSPRAVVVDEARLDLLVRRLTRQEGVPPAVGSREYGVGSREYGVGSRKYGIAHTCPTAGAGRSPLGRVRKSGIRTQEISPPRRSGRGDQALGSRGRGPSSPDSLSPESLSPDSPIPDSLSPESPRPDRRGGLLPTSYSLLPTANSSGAAHAWLALKVYQGLGQFVRLPARTPQVLLEHLAAQAGPDALAVAETAAETTLAALKEALAGRVPFPPWPEDGLPVEESLAVIQEALAEGGALEMDYYTAGRDVLTHRVVEPYRLEERSGIHYLVGFCHHAQAERVFRLDRISSIVKVP